MYIVTRSNDVLLHYGVKGMRWGVRHDNRSSGGRGRSIGRTAAIIASPVGYGIVKGGISVGKKGAKKAKEVKLDYDSAKKQRIENRKKKAMDQHTSGRYTYKQRKHLSNAQLQKRIDRLQMEKKLKDLAKEDSRDFTTVKTGMREARKALGYYGAKVVLDTVLPGSGKFVKNPNK